MRVWPTPPMPEIIFDTYVLSNFALSGSLPLLKTLYPRSAYITDLVALENLRGIQKGYAALSAVRQAVDEVWLREVSCASLEEKRLFETLSLSLGAGMSSLATTAPPAGKPPSVA